MITVRKLASLPERTRLRKTARVLAGLVRDPHQAGPRYQADLLALIAAEHGLPEPVRDHARALSRVDEPGLARPHGLSGLLAEVESVLGLEPAEWDLPSLVSAGVPGGAALGSVTLFAELVRSPFNLGSIVRTAAAFGVQRVELSQGVTAHRNPRFARSAMGADQVCPVVEQRPLPASSTERPVVALETGGTAVGEFQFPEAGVLLIGSEELGLSPEALATADARVSVPMPGAKASLNVGVAVGIVLSWWSARLSGRTT